MEALIFFVTFLLLVWLVTRHQEWEEGTGFSPEDSHHPKGGKWHWVNGENSRYCAACRDRLAAQDDRPGYLP